MKRINLNIAACEFCGTELTFADTLAKKASDQYSPCKQCRTGFKFRWLNFIERLRTLNFSDLFKHKRQPVLIDTNTPAKTELSKTDSEFETERKEFQDFCRCVKTYGVVMISTDGKHDVLLYPTDKIPEAIKPGNIPEYRKMLRREKRGK